MNKKEIDKLINALWSIFISGLKPKLKDFINKKIQQAKEEERKRIMKLEEKKK